MAHERLLILRVDAEGGLIVLDKDGNPPRKNLSASAALLEAGEEYPLSIIEIEREGDVEEPACCAVRDPAAAVSAAVAVSSIDDLPPVLHPHDWRLLEPRLEWSQARRAFLFHPDVALFSTPFSAPRGAELKNGAFADNELGKRRSLFSSPLRPQSLCEFVGQRRLVESLRIAARGALKRGEPMGHLLLSGQGGLGKTTIAGLLSEEMGSDLRIAMGPLLEEPSQVMGLLSSLKRGDILLIDEIHRLNAACEECLYAPMEDWALDLVLAQGTRLRTIRLLLEPFTLVGATTRLGSLSEPFRARFKLEERLELYGEEDLAEVVLRAGSRSGLSITSEAAQAIAQLGRGTPREALRLLERARDSEQAQPVHQSKRSRHDRARARRRGCREAWNRRRRPSRRGPKDPQAFACRGSAPGPSGDGLDLGRRSPHA